MDALVIGGGAIGCSIAYHLQKAGAQVTLADRERIGGGASSAAAGMLAPFAESSQPGPFSRLAQLGLAAFNEQAAALIEESGIDFEYRRDGILRVAESDEEEARLRAALPWQRQSGAEAEWLAAGVLARLEPRLAPGIRGALFTRNEGHVNPARLTAALATAAARLGARPLEGCRIEGFERQGARLLAARWSGGALQADHFVLAGGAWSERLSHELDLTIPVYPVRGQMAALAQIPAAVRHIVYSHDGYLVPKSDGSIWVGATEETDAGYDASVTAARLRWLLGAACRLVPDLGSARYLRSWAGLRPCAPDLLPILGPLPGFDNVSIATGHFRNGILMSLVTGRLLAEQITFGLAPPDLLAFSPARFSH